MAKRLDSVYEPGARSGAWRKMRINRTQEFVIGGYTRGGRTFDAIIVGRYDGERLVYVARTRVGFTPASRERLMEKLKAPGDPDVSVREPPRGAGGPVGRRAYGGEDEGVRLGAARAGGGGRVRGVDAGRASTACAVRWLEGHVSLSRITPIRSRCRDLAQMDHRRSCARPIAVASGHEARRAY